MFRAVPWWVAVIVVFAVMFFTDRIRLREPDYFLLLTFIVFFVFSGNIGRIPAVRSALQRLTEQNVLMTGALASQVISNVPAAVLLAPFTDDPVALMIGTDIGGFGTPIASMANLITLKLYLRTEDCRAGRYFLYFAIVNAAGFALMTAAALLTGVG